MQSNHIYSILGLGLVVGLALCLYLRNLKVVPSRHSDSCVSFRAHVRFAPLYPVTEVLPSRQFAISKMSISPTTVASFLIVRLLIDNNCLLFLATPWFYCIFALSCRRNAFTVYLMLQAMNHIEPIKH